MATFKTLSLKQRGLIVGMNNFTFENQGTTTYLVYSIGQNDCLDTMSLGMLTNNKIAGLAATMFTQMDSTKYIKYNVSSKISVKQFFSGAVNKKRLLGVFSGIVNAMLSAEDYMIDVNTILLDKEYIFADVSTCETVLVCLPIVNSETEAVDLGMFFKNIMFSTQFDQTENCDHVAKIINYLNSAPVFSLSDFKTVVESIKNETSVSPVVKVQSTSQQKPVVQAPINNVAQPPVIQTQPKAPAPAQKKLPEVQPVQQKVIPQQPPVQSPAVPQVNQNAADEKKISMFGLLMHYNKENAELYKAQKAAKKGQPATVQQVPPTPVPQKQTPANFAVPGAPTPNTGFAVPGQPSPAPAVQQKVQPNIQQQAPVKQPVTVGAAPVQNVPQQPVMPQGQPMNFGETTVLGGGNIGETTVLNAGQQQQQAAIPQLLRTKNNEKILLDKPVFRIGKERSYVDYFISDNTAISRSHANLVSRDGKYYVVDTNSTNHTYLNGQMLQSNTETEIEHGTKIRLANEEFEFRLY